MTNLYFAIFFFSVLHISSSWYAEHHIGEVNDTGYFIKESVFVPTLDPELIMIKSNGVMRKLSYPTCGRERIDILSDRMKIRGSLLFVHIRDLQSGENFLQIIDLPALSNNITHEACIPVIETYFGRHKIYIYRVEEDHILKRWLITEDGEETNPAVVAKTEFSIKAVVAHSQGIEIKTSSGATDDFFETDDYEDLPRCDSMENDISCKEDKDVDKTPYIIPTIKYEEFDAGELNGTNYFIRESIFTNVRTREIVTIESNGTMKKFSLPNCGREAMRTLNTSKNPRENLFLNRRDSMTDEQFLQIVDLADLSDDMTNGTCMPVADVYFGEYKIYAYKIEEGNIVKRWLITEDGYEINPQLVVKTKDPIIEVHVVSTDIEVRIKPKDKFSYFPITEHYKDLPRCDTPDDNSSCTEDQTSMKPKEALIESALESHVKTKVIAFGAFSFILIVLGIGYFLCNPKSRKGQDCSKMDSRNYNFIDQTSLDATGNEIPKILLSTRPSFLSRQKS